jgi:hypothetical protein
MLSIAVLFSFGFTISSLAAILNNHLPIGRGRLALGPASLNDSASSLLGNLIVRIASGGNRLPCSALRIIVHAEPLAIRRIEIGAHVSFPVSVVSFQQPTHTMTAYQMQPKCNGINWKSHRNSRFPGIF